MTMSTIVMHVPITISLVGNALCVSIPVHVHKILCFKGKDVNTKLHIYNCVAI